MMKLSGNFMTRILPMPLALPVLPSPYLRFLQTPHATLCFEYYPSFIRLQSYSIQLAGYRLPGISSKNSAPLLTPHCIIIAICLSMSPHRRVSSMRITILSVLPNVASPTSTVTGTEKTVNRCLSNACRQRSSAWVAQALYRPFFMHRNTLIYLPLQLQFQPMIKSKARNYFHSGNPLI